MYISPGFCHESECQRPDELKIIGTFAATMLVGAGLTIPAQSQQADEATAVRHLIMQTFDKPDAPLTVEPVTVLADVAVAGWAQGDMGGATLLRKKHGSWSLDLCSGDALKDAKALQRFGPRLFPPIKRVSDNPLRSDQLIADRTAVPLRAMESHAAIIEGVSDFRIVAPPTARALPTAIQSRIEWPPPIAECVQ